MIKNYNQFINESLLDKLKGPTEEEVVNNILNLEGIDFIEYVANDNEFDFKIPDSYKDKIDEKLWDILLKVEPIDFIHIHKCYTFSPNIEEKINNILPIIINKLEETEKLKYCSEIGDLDGVKEAIKNGADISYLNTISLKNAAEKGHLNIVKYLVEQGANVNDFSHLSNANRTALAIACYYGHLDIVKYLIEHGADIHDNNDDALHSAIRTSKVYDDTKLLIIDFLIKNNANPFAHNSALSSTITYDYIYYDIIEYLLENIKYSKDNSDIIRLNSYKNNQRIQELLKRYNYLI